MIKVGVIGVGSMGINHARIYSELEKEGRVKLVGVSDASEERANEVAARYKTLAFADYKRLLSQSPDAVSIAVPTTLHKKVALNAIGRGIHVLVEKPIADTTKNAEGIIKATGKNNIKLQVGHVERFNPAVTKLKKLIDAGELGKVVSISTKRVGPYNPRIRDVGIILDLGVHDIDIISHLFGQRVETVFAKAGSSIHTKEDHAIVVLNFEGDQCGIIETNWLTPHKTRTLNVVGTGGIAYVDYIKQTLEVYDKEQAKNMTVERKEPLRLELESFLQCVENDSGPEVSGEDGLYALKVAVAASKSAEKQAIVKV